MVSILEEAIEVTTQRQTSHDVPENNFKRIADLWNAYLSNRENQDPLNPADVAMMMVLFKVSREMWNHNRDNIVDMAGYAHCLARIRGLYGETET